jgi:hypothetical protein
VELAASEEPALLSPEDVDVDEPLPPAVSVEPAAEEAVPASPQEAAAAAVSASRGGGVREGLCPFRGDHGAQSRRRRSEPGRTRLGAY